MNDDLLQGLIRSARENTMHNKPAANGETYYSEAEFEERLEIDDGELFLQETEIRATLKLQKLILSYMFATILIATLWELKEERKRDLEMTAARLRREWKLEAPIFIDYDMCEPRESWEECDIARVNLE
ncbi:uncharacterized protein PG986_009726 [Apiospora aurea]|uniref:Uncharacterized protein n=1 Tax=Apiospora aurea TaxID=335848 RepID=A0ABR1Q8J3_9PEZI